VNAFLGMNAALAARVISVLFVSESFEASAEYVAAALERGWTTKATFAVPSAWEMVQSGGLDAVVVREAAGGRIDGVALARRVKSDVATHHVPVVVLSDHASGHLQERHVVLEHPCEPADVIDAIAQSVAVSELLARRRALRCQTRRDEPVELFSHVRGLFPQRPELPAEVQHLRVHDRLVLRERREPVDEEQQNGDRLRPLRVFRRAHHVAPAS
jgi:DNA-binding response OmpR family regulator